MCATIPPQTCLSNKYNRDVKKSDYLKLSVFILNEWFKLKNYSYLKIAGVVRQARFFLLYIILIGKV